MNNQNTNNWNAGMEMMAAMMSMFGGAVQQPKGSDCRIFREFL